MPAPFLAVYGASKAFDLSFAEALMAGKDHVVPGSMKNRLQDAAAQVMPEPAKAATHRKQTEPGLARK
jgi:short-subunit dehydrogenase